MTAQPRAESPPPVSMRRDLAAAYFAAGCRLGASVVVSALLFRFAGAAEFGMYALVRGTIGLLNYVTLGLAPALIHQAAGADDAIAPAPVLRADDGLPGGVLPYAAPPGAPAPTSLQVLYANALRIVAYTAAIGVALSIAYGMQFDRLYRVPRGLHAVIGPVVILIGLGTVMRLSSDAPGGILQARNRIALDNILLAGGDLLWVILAIGAPRALPLNAIQLLLAVAVAHAASGIAVYFARFVAAGREVGILFPPRRWTNSRVMRQLLGYGALVVAAQLADYLYTPTDYILIDRLLPTINVTYYAPAVQIDSGLLLLVTGLSAVMLPKAAIAHASGSIRTVRRYYVRGTLASLAMLAAASLAVWALGPWIFRIWLGNPMPGTQAILPLVLIGTTLGGASAVGRSVLLAVGKARAYAISVLLAGILSAGGSYLFVRYGHLGLRGILLGTVVAVVLRCVVWMPWYVMRTLEVLRTDR